MIRSIGVLMGEAPEGATAEEKALAARAKNDRDWGTGTSAMLNVLPGGPGATFAAKLETLKSQAFLPMVAQLKGMGQLSDAEGKKLTAAIGALDSSMREEDFLASLKQIKADLTAARGRMTGSAPTGSGQPARKRFNPETGMLE